MPIFGLMLVSLVELGIPAGEPSAVRAAGTVLGWLTGREHRSSIVTIGGLVRCHASQEGNALAVCAWKEDGTMPAKYDQETKARAIRLVRKPSACRQAGRRQELVVREVLRAQVEEHPAAVGSGDGAVYAALGDPQAELDVPQPHTRADAMHRSPRACLGRDLQPSILPKKLL
jgi:hypothetical protein